MRRNIHFSGHRIKSEVIISILMIFSFTFFHHAACLSANEDLTDELCISCHPDVNMTKTAHAGKKCIECHIDIKEIPHKNDPQRIDCTLCHTSMGGGNLGMDVHARARAAGNKRAPDCANCHGTHDVAPRTRDDSPMNPQNMRSFCATCHADTPAPAVYHKEVTLNKMVCKGCHESGLKDVSQVDYKKFSNSIHKVLECVDCHGDITEVPHDKGLKKVECWKCHVGAGEQYKQSIHGVARMKGIEEAPTCQSCHGDHEILPGRDLDSTVNPGNVPRTCGNAKCHSNPEMAKKYGIPMENPYEHYEKSIHAKKLREGNLNSATCQKCHGSHDILPLDNPRSAIFKGNVAKTCSRCHSKIYEDFVGSIHWKGYLKGVRDAPVCTDCHLEHEIVQHNDPKSAVYKGKVPNLCTDCHENARIAERYGISVMRLDSYLQSYHGLAQKSGNLEAANCISCHEQHKILDPDDPESSVNPLNLGATCGKCHPGVTDTLKKTEIHKASPGIGGNVINIVKTVYIWVICLSVISMLLFELIDLRAKVRRGEVGLFSNESKEHRYYTRFNSVERFIHMVIFISFAALVYTGFAHRYPDALWAHPVSKWLPFIFRDSVHRVAGAALIAITLLQFTLMPLTRRGRTQLGAILPRPRDLIDAIRMLRHNINHDKPAPRFARYSFIEKFEFWAFIWGSLLMAVTGLGLWFKETLLSYFPKWILDLFLTIHFYEAILASLAILIWHFYWTIFNPHIYPMDRTWLSGKISEERLKEEYPGEWERIEKDQDKN